MTVKFKDLTFSISINNGSLQVSPMVIIMNNYKKIFADTLDFLKLNDNFDMPEDKFAALIVHIMTLATFNGVNLYDTIYTDEYKEYRKNNPDTIESLNTISGEYYTGKSTEFGKFIV